MAASTALAMAAAGLITTNVAGAAAAADRPAPAAHSAQSADAFVDSIGINTHVGYVDRAYGNYGAWKSRLVESGIRNIRDGVAVNQQFAYDRLNELAGLGIKTDLQLGRPFNGKWSGLSGDSRAAANNPAGTLSDLLTVLKTKVPGAVQSVEGPNEYDIAGDSAWAPNLRSYQSDLYNAVKADPALAHLPVIAPALVNESSRGTLGRVSSDLGNVHNYTGGQQETSAHISSELSLAFKVSGGAPVWSTESNPNTALQSSSNQPPTSEKAQATYTLRQYLEDWRKGISKTFIYELMDESANTADAEQSWGIVHADGSPKPAFTALKNMIGLLADPGQSSSSGSLSYNLAGATPQTRTVLLRKHDGSVWLAVWQESSVWDTSKRQALAPATAPLTLDLGAQTATFSTYQPGRGAAATATTGRSSTLKVSSSADVTLVAVRGLAAATASAAAPATTTTLASAPAPGPDQSRVPAVVARINSGGPAMKVNGQAWSADRWFQGGTASDRGTKVSSATATVDRSERWGATGYSVPVPVPGRYVLRLHTTELFFGAAAQRRFDVSVEGRTVASNLDVFGKVGKNRTYVMSIPVTVTDGRLDLGFLDKVNYGTVSGIEVLGQPSSSTLSARVGAHRAAAAHRSMRHVASRIHRTRGGYSIGVPKAGRYVLLLHTSGVRLDKAHKRTFDVVVNGRTVVHSVAVRAGKTSTHVVRIPATATGKKVSLRFRNRTGGTSVTAIEVLRG